MIQIKKTILTLVALLAVTTGAWAQTVTVKELTAMGFHVLPSKANFIFAKHESISGIDIYTKLRENGILVRHFTDEKIKDYNRITIGTKEQMVAFIDAVKNIKDSEELKKYLTLDLLR